MAFTLRQIEVFVEAAKDQNFRKTADRLGISQPSVSKHLKLLELHSGGKLFERDRGSAARLSPLGEKMLAEARALLRTAGKVSETLASDVVREGPLRIMAGEYLLDQWLRPQMRRLATMADMPELQMIQSDNHKQIVDAVRAGQADLGLYTGLAFDDPEIAVRVLHRATVGLFACPALAAGVVQVPGDIAQLGFISSPKGSPADQWQAAMLEGAGIGQVQVAVRTQFMEVMVDMVLGGRGAALLFDDDVRAHVASGRLVRFALDFPPGLRCMVWRKDARFDARRLAAIEAIGACLAQPRD